MFVIVYDIMFFKEKNVVFYEVIYYKDIFFFNMSYEIRMFMNVIIGFFDLMEWIKFGLIQWEYLDVIFVAGNNFLVIINDIFDFLKIEVGKIDLEFKLLELKKVIQDVIKFSQFRVEEKGFCLKVSLDMDVLEYIMGDFICLY